MLGYGGYSYGRCQTLGAQYTAGTTCTGTTVTASGTANAKGSWQSFGTPSFQYEGIHLVLGQTATGDKMLDIGINNGSGNWHTLVDDLALPGRKSNDQVHAIYLPLRVKAGQNLGLRLASTTGGQVLTGTIHGFSSGLYAVPGYSRIKNLTGTTNLRGIAIDPGATASTKSGWTQLVASTPADLDGLFVVMGPNADISRTAAATALFDIGVGSSGNEYPLIENVFYRWTTTLDGPLNYFRFPQPIGAGKRLVARGACTDVAAGDRTFDLALYGFIP